MSFTAIVVASLLTVSVGQPAPEGEEGLWVVPVDAEPLGPGPASALTHLLFESLRERFSGRVEASEGPFEGRWHVRLRALPLAKDTLFVLTLHRPDGSIEVSRRVTTLLDDAAKLVPRMVEAALENSELAETRNLDNIIDQEARPPKRRGGDNILGPRFAVSVPTLDYAPMASFQFSGRFAVDDSFLEFAAGPLIPLSYTDGPSYGGFTIDLGMSRFLNHDATSVYLGGGLNPRFIFAESVLAVLPYVQGGVMFMRDASTKAFFELRLAQNVLPIRTFNHRSKDGSLGDQDGGDLPTEFGIAVGIGW